jgi:outer membrane protein assembly factor BamB
MKNPRPRYIALIIVAFCVVIVSSLLYLSSIFPFSDNNFPLHEKWSRQLGEGITDISVSQTGIALVNATDRIVALEIDQGGLLWSKQFNVQLKPFPISIQNDALYFVDTDSLQAFDLETGIRLWHQRLQNSHARILDVSDNYLVVDFLSTSINTYDTRTGAFLWSLPTRRGYVQAFVDNNNIYVLGDEIKEVNAKTGSILWTENLDVKGEGYYANGVMYFAGGDPFNKVKTYIVAFNVVDHKELWRTELTSQEVNEYLMCNTFEIRQKPSHPSRVEDGQRSN